MSEHDPAVSSTAATRSVLLVTCSYRGDISACRALCESVDRWVDEHIEHLIVVPPGDVKLFSELSGPRRRIATDNDYLPNLFFKLPMPSAKWRKRLRLPRRNIYVTPFSPPVRGWIAQQLIKIATARDASADIVVHVDSDNTFIRRFGADEIVREDKVRLYRDPVRVASETHPAWHRAAGRLLGLEPRDFYDAEYIDQLVVWRPEVVRQMTAHIEQVTGRRWWVALCRTLHFAEYILYGVFSDKVRGLEASGHYADEKSLCLTRWSGEFASEVEETAFAESVERQHVICCLQSTIALSSEVRSRVHGDVERRAAIQDATPF